MIELRHLRYFLAVAQELHFSRAAARLGISPPTLSHQIGSLESQLGARLFTRKTKSSVVMTNAGRRFFEEASATLKQAAQAELIGRRAARGEAGTVALGYVLSASLGGLVADTVTTFKNSHPDVTVQLRNLETFPQLKAIIDGSLDVGLMRAPQRYPADLSGFVVERQPFRLAVPAGHRLASQRRITPASLTSEPLIAAPLEIEIGFWGNIAAILPAGAKVNIVERAPDAITVLNLVAAGAGIAVVSGALSRLAIPGVVYRDIAFAPRQADHAVVHRKGERAPVVAAFLKALRQRRVA